MILTDKEREKFASYLEESARDADGLEQQLGFLPGASQNQLAQKLRVEAMAARVIAKKLRNTVTD